jgi:hypothetical protein
MTWAPVFFVSALVRAGSERLRHDLATAQSQSPRRQCVTSILPVLGKLARLGALVQSDRPSLSCGV